MTDTKELLSAASVCRVYASAGMAVVWGPAELRRHADLLDKHKAECDSTLAAARAAREESDQQLQRIRDITMFNICALAGTLIVVLTCACGKDRDSPTSGTPPSMCSTRSGARSIWTWQMVLSEGRMCRAAPASERIVCQNRGAVSSG